MQGCEHSIHKCTRIATAAEIEQVVGKPIVAFNVEEDGSSINLCQAHYNYLYSQLTLSAACESCGGKLRKGERCNRHCPEPNSINTYLTIVRGDPCHLTAESLVCTACYKHFKVILRNLQKAKPLTPSPSNEQRNAVIDKQLSSLSLEASAYLVAETVPLLATTLSTLHAW